MKQKLLAALEQRYGGALGSKNEIYEKVVSAYGNLIASEEQIPDIVAGVEPLLKSFQSVNDKLRTLELKTEPPKPSETGENNPEPNPNPEPPKDEEKIPAWAQALIDSNKALSEKLTAFETEQNAKTALQGAEGAFKANEYVKKYADEATDAWERAIELYEAKGKTWTAEELQEKAMGYFNKAVSRKGVDTSKPMPSDGGAGGDGESDFSSFDRAAEKLGWKNAGGENNQ